MIHKYFFRTFHSIVNFYKLHFCKNDKKKFFLNKSTKQSFFNSKDFLLIPKYFPMNLLYTNEISNNMYT